MSKLDDFSKAENEKLIRLVYSDQSFNREQLAALVPKTTDRIMLFLEGVVVADNSQKGKGYKLREEGQPNEKTS